MAKGWSTEINDTITVRDAFLAMTDFIGVFLSESEFSWNALIEHVQIPDGVARDAAGWPLWVESVSRTMRGLEPRSTLEPWVTSEGGPGFVIRRSYNFDSNEQITIDSAFACVGAYLQVFCSTAGEDSLTLFADTEIEADGGPFDAAAWGDWLSTVDGREIRRDASGPSGHRNTG